MAKTTKVVGPYAPKDFQDTSTMSATLTTDVAAAAGSNTIAGAEPITILGNIFLIVTTN